MTGDCHVRFCEGLWLQRRGLLSCLPVKLEAEPSIAPREAVGIDLGLKDIAVTSEGERLGAGRWTLRLCR